jgi:hypothetical protein
VVVGVEEQESNRTDRVPGGEMKRKEGGLGWYKLRLFARFMSFYLMNRAHPSSAGSSLAGMTHPRRPAGRVEAA